MIQLFVSYRRSDTKSFAHRLYDRLRRVFKRKSVFMDVSDIEPGADFPKIIEARLSSCRVLLVIIGDTWLTCTDDAGQRRLRNPNDYVRLEVAKGLAAADILVIPVLVNGAAMPTAEELPEDLKPLAVRNAVEIDDDRLDTDIVKLIDAIGTRVPRRSRLLMLSAAATAALLLAVGGIWLHGQFDPGYGARLVPGVTFYTRLPEQSGGGGMRYVLTVEADGHSATLADLTKEIVYTGAAGPDLEKLQRREDKVAVQSEVMQRYQGVDRADAIVRKLLDSANFLPVAGGKAGAKLRVQVDKSPEGTGQRSPWFECQFVLGSKGQTFFLAPQSENCHPIDP